jgi:hypothetical protein
MDCFTHQSPEDLSIPNVPEGYSFLVRTEGDATFARELLRADIILRFGNLEVGQSESEDGDLTKWSYVFEQFWNLANVHLLLPMFFSQGSIERIECRKDPFAHAEKPYTSCIH